MVARRRIDTKPLVDEFLEVKRAKKDAEKKYDELRAKIVALGMPICKGTNQSVILLERHRNSLDAEMLKADYGLDWYEGYCKYTTYYELQEF